MKIIRNYINMHWLSSDPTSPKRCELIKSIAIDIREKMDSGRIAHPAEGRMITIALPGLSQDDYDEFVSSVQKVLYGNGFSTDGLDDSSRLIIEALILNLMEYSDSYLNSIKGNRTKIKSPEVKFDKNFDPYFVHPTRENLAKFPHVKLADWQTLEPMQSKFEVIGELQSIAEPRLQMNNPSWDALAREVAALNELALEISDKFDALTNGDNQ